MTKTQPTLAIVMAHPDDAELLCFGTIRKYLQDGYKVYLFIVCSGEYGISVQDKQRLGKDSIDTQVRAQETLEAFQDLDVQVKFLGYKDSHIQMNNQLISDIEKHLAEVRPEILITHYVEASGFDHQDHTVTGQCTLNASVRLTGLRTILMSEAIQSFKMDFKPNFFVNITDYFEQKMVAINAHKSQAGRVYLMESFHLLRCQRNALAAGTDYYRDGLLFEGFISKTIRI
jgi:N-acetylglucosamine malate deacetylase 1